MEQLLDTVDQENHTYGQESNNIKAVIPSRQVNRNTKQFQIFNF
jgi:hypothetical protein